MSTTMANIQRQLLNINLPVEEQRLSSAGIRFLGKGGITGNEPADTSYGIEETLDVVAVIMMVTRAFMEGGITSYLSILMALPTAIAGFKQVPNELNDLDEKEIQTLIDYVVQNYPNTPSETAKLIIEHSIKAVYNIYIVVIAITQANAEENQKKTAHEINTAVKKAIRNFNAGNAGNAEMEATHNVPGGVANTDMANDNREPQ